MIYTVTFNPSIDLIESLDGFTLGKTNRTTKEKVLPGGKGINVSTVLKNLGFESTALGFLAGHTGDWIEEMVDGLGIKTDFIKLNQGFSRINVKLSDYDGTELNGLGPNIPKGKLLELFTKLEVLQDGDLLVLAGSIPASLPQSIYEDIIKMLSQRNILFVVDATKDLLVNVVKMHPFLIKPNIHELGEIFQVSLDTKESVLPYVKKLQEMGARNVIVSMSKDGAVLVTEEGDVYRMDAPKGKLVNAVGSGDSMVAGFIAGWLQTHDYAKAFHMGICSGSASAFSENLASGEEIKDLMERTSRPQKAD